MILKLFSRLTSHISESKKQLFDTISFNSLIILIIYFLVGVIINFFLRPEYFRELTYGSFLSNLLILLPLLLSILIRGHISIIVIPVLGLVSCIFGILSGKKRGTYIALTLLAVVIIEIILLGILIGNLAIG